MGWERWFLDGDFDGFRLEFFMVVLDGEWAECEGSRALGDEDIGQTH